MRMEYLQHKNVFVLRPPHTNPNTQKFSAPCNENNTRTFIMNISY